MKLSICGAPLANGTSCGLKARLRLSEPDGERRVMLLCLRCWALWAEGFAERYRVKPQGPNITLWERIDA